MIEIKEVITKKDRKIFVELPLKTYKGNEYFVPPLYMDEMAVFTDKNIYSKTCDSSFFLAYKDGKPVGRIQGIIQRQYNEIHSEKRARFTRFDCIDDKDVAKALFDAVENWAKANCMDTVCGPLGYSDLEREGLLIEGFDWLNTFEEQYNYEYYKDLIESCGYEKEVDWVEYRLFSDGKEHKQLPKIAKRALEMNHLHLAPKNMSTSKFIDRYGDGIFHCIDECYKHLYGTVPFTDDMKKQMIEQFKLFINKKYIIVILDESERVVSFGFCIPGIGKALQRSGGRLTPVTLIKLLNAVIKPRSLDLALVAVLPEYQNKGVNAVFLAGMVEYLEDKRVEYMETNLNLEYNTSIQAMWKHFKAIQHKRRRSFVKKLSD